MDISNIKPFPAGQNPFCHDSYHMGIPIGKNVMVMMPNHSTENCPYLIIVNVETGERIQINF